MSQTLTIDDIWQLFQETRRMFQESQEHEKRAWEETRRAIREGDAETDRQFQELKQAFQETDRRFQETDRRFQETDRQFQETDRRFQETDRQFQELKQAFRETDRIVKDVSRQIGQLGSRWGEFVEGLVAPACETLFAERGIPVHKVSRYVSAKLSGNRHMEIDLLVVNTEAVVLVEVKSRLLHDDVQDHLTRLAEFKEFFQEYTSKRVMGAVAGIAIAENVGRLAMNQGLFVIVQSGDTVKLANGPDFQPRTW